MKYISMIYPLKKKEIILKTNLGHHSESKKPRNSIDINSNVCGENQGNMKEMSEGCQCLCFINVFVKSNTFSRPFKYLSFII